MQSHTGRREALRQIRIACLFALLHVATRCETFTGSCATSEDVSESHRRTATDPSTVHNRLQRSATHAQLAQRFPAYAAGKILRCEFLNRLKNWRRKILADGTLRKVDGSPCTCSLFIAPDRAQPTVPHVKV